LHGRHKMRPMSGRRAGFWPILDYPADSALIHGEERDRPRMLHAVGNRNVRNGLVVIADNAVDGECPGAISRVLLIQEDEALSPANAFLGLRPLQHEFRGKHGGDRKEVIGSHQAPELLDDIDCLVPSHYALLKAPNELWLSRSAGASAASGGAVGSSRRLGRICAFVFSSRKKSQ